MKRIIYAWEIGDGLGHVRNMVAIARQQELAGYKAVFALPADQRNALNYLEREGFDEIRTFHKPISSGLTRFLKPWQEYRAASFVDVLAAYAYDDDQRLSPLLSQVNGILWEGASAVVTESAPTFNMLAQNIAPTIAVGTSFGLPQHVSCHHPYPRLDNAPLTPLLGDDQIADIIARSQGKPHSIPSLNHYFKPTAIVPMCYPFFDLYEDERDDASAGVGPAHQLEQMMLPADGHFCYLSAKHPKIDQIMIALKDSKQLTRVFVAGKDYSWMKSPHMTVLKSFDLKEEMRNCRRVVHHGSAGMIQAAMGAGRAQLAFPYHIENTQNTAKIFKFSNINAVGYRETHRFVGALNASYEVEMKGAMELADVIEQNKKFYGGAQRAAQVVSDLLRN